MKIQLTKYSHGAGCGCKISPAILDKILHSAIAFPADPHLLVGNDTRDDAAVYDLGNGQALISTTDFFMPIVDDAFNFGRIASANAISDVYAMGGRPILAIAILGWPLDKLPRRPPARSSKAHARICAEAGISLAGGHSIDCPEPYSALRSTALSRSPISEKIPPPRPEACSTLPNRWALVSCPPHKRKASLPRRTRRAP